MNPQWLVFPSVDAAEFTFVLSQAKHEGVDAIGLWIAVADKPEGRKTLMSDGQLVTRSKFTHAKHQMLEATLIRRKDGLPYILSVATDRPNIQGRFTLSVSSPNDYQPWITPIDADDLPAMPPATQPKQAPPPAAAYEYASVPPRSVAAPTVAPATTLTTASTTAPASAPATTLTTQPNIPHATSPSPSPHMEPMIKVPESVWFAAAESGDLATLAASVPPLRHMDVSDADGDTALIIAARCNQLETVKLLLKRKADPGVRNELGCTALHAAACNGHLEVARLFIGNCDMNSCDNAGHTPLHDSVWNCHDSVARLLVEAGASTLTTNKTGDTPLTTALKLGDPAFASMLELLREASIAEAGRVTARRWLLLRWGLVLLLVLLGAIFATGQLPSTTPSNTSALTNSTSPLAAPSSFSLPAVLLEPRPLSIATISTLAIPGGTLLLPTCMLLAGAAALTAIVTVRVIVRGRPIAQGPHRAVQPAGLVLL
jgi:ankyrin repeat protein